MLWIGTSNPTQKLEVNWNVKVSWWIKTTCIWNCF
jgi:hypothetical protein